MHYEVQDNRRIYILPRFLVFRGSIVHFEYVYEDLGGYNQIKHYTNEDV